jgi:hypothetical protein
VRYRENGDVVAEPDEHNAIGKVVYRQAPYIRIRDPRNDRSGRREPLEMLQRPGYFGGKSRGDLGTTFSVPRNGLS